MFIESTFINDVASIYNKKKKNHDNFKIVYVSKCQNISLMNKSTEIDISIDENTSESNIRAMMDQSIRDFNHKYRVKTPNEKRKEQFHQETSSDKKKYDALLAKVAKHQEQLAKLEDENALLRAEVERCEAKIRAYPKAKKRYDQLTESIQRAHQLTSKSLSRK